MPSALKVPDLKASLVRREIPTITTWNRLEARPRSQSFERALQAEVRDALQMLTKQWQMGEFRGSDNGSPVFAALLNGRLTKYSRRAARQLFDPTIPLETKVERRSIAPSAGPHPLARSPARDGAAVARAHRVAAERLPERLHQGLSDRHAESVEARRGRRLRIGGVGHVSGIRRTCDGRRRVLRIPRR